MKKGEIYEGTIEKVDFPNKGTVMIGDQKVTVKNGIPGQKIRFMINKKRSGQGRRTSAGSSGEISSGNQRPCLFHFSGMWRLYVPDHVL